jgi:hypothetical protein
MRREKKNLIFPTRIMIGLLIPVMAIIVTGLLIKMLPKIMTG